MKIHIVFIDTIIGNQSAAIVIAGELDLIDVNLVHGSVPGLSILLEDCLAIYSGRCCDLFVNVVRNLDVTTDLIESVSVSA